ncbi:MAG: hypothetical protein F6K31_36240 [Symploca sp. SIO2G7]|nr:hypothetical protein [Symploca sp. SIO2G7]
MDKTYWGETFYSTHLGELKVFLWALKNNKKEIFKSRIKFRSPKLEIKKSFNSDYTDWYWSWCFYLPIYISVPFDLIHKCGTEVLGDDQWDIPF